MARAFLSSAIHSYGAATILYLWHFVSSRPRVAFFGLLALVLGFVLQLTGIVLRYLETGISPIHGVADGLALLACLLVGSYVVVDRVYRLPAVGAFVTPLVLAVLVPAHYLRGSSLPLPDALRAAALWAHVVIAFLGVASFALATGLSLMYVLMERELKGKRFGLFFSRLPSLDRLDSAASHLVRFGFVALSITIATGAFFQKQEGGGYLHWDAKQTLSLLAWAVYAALVNARLLAGWRGRRVAILTVLGFVILVGSLVGTYAAPPPPPSGTS